MRLFPVQGLGVRKGARVWEAEDWIPGLPLPLLASASHLWGRGDGPLHGPALIMHLLFRPLHA